MRLKVIHIGKTSSKEVKSMVSELVKRLGRFAKCEVIAITKVKAGQTDPADLKRKEGEAILSSIQSTDFMVLLDEKGDHWNSRRFSDWLRLHFVNDSRPMVLVIGGAYGFSDEVYTRANAKLSLSKMTFNHELALLVLVEQLYRALTIIHGHPYHND
jgi:23S rRNA (pseudouridine1915-N3)-methyltransferase